MTKLLLTATALCCSLPAVAQDQRDPELFNELSEQIGFSATVSTPDLLDPAILPYFRCLHPGAGNFKGGQGFVEIGVGLRSACESERETAVSQATEILKKAGISDTNEINFLVEETLYVLDLEATSTAAFMKRRN